MRPLRLIVTAFGPYSGKTVLNFEELHDQNIFVITGPTGAGKTTIFDAICYALYGETSGIDRNTKGLRSDFLSEGTDLITEVEYTFMIKNKIYSIVRCPEQMIPKKRGEGLREMKHTVTLSCVGHEEFSPISNVSEVVNKVNEIIGLDQEQFKKIVMIPQGEFRKFLQSNTDEKEKILRKIFGTQVFESIQKRLNYEARELYIQVKDGQQRLLENLKMVDATGQEDLEGLIAQEGNILEILPLLEQAIERDLEQEKFIGEQLHHKQGELKVIQEQLGAAKINNQMFVTHQQMVEQLAMLTVQEKQMTIEADQLSLAKQAKSIEPLAKNSKDFEQQWKNSELAINTLMEQKQKATNRVELVQARLHNLQAQEKEQEQWQQKKIQLENKREEVIIYDQKRQECAQQEQQVMVLERKYKELEQEEVTNKERIDQFNKQLENNREAQLQLALVEQQLVTKSQQCDHLRKLYGNGKEMGKSLQYLAMEGKDIVASQRKIEQLRNQSKEKRIQYIASLGANLAKELVDGQPCPVCGSHTHPAPCGTSELMIDIEDIENIEQQLITEQDKLQQLLGKKEQEEGRINALLNIIGEELGLQEIQLTTAVMEQKLSEILAKGKAASKEVEDLKIQQKQLAFQGEQVEQIKQEIAKLTERGKTLEEQHKEKFNQWNQHNQQWNTNKGALAALIERIPERYRVKGVLENELVLLEKNIQGFKDQLKKAEQEKEEAANELKILEGQITAATQHNEENKIRYEQAKQLWQEEVQSKFTDVEQYGKARGDIPQIESMEARIEQYQTQLQEAKTRLKQAEERIDGLVVIDLAILEEQINQTAQQISQISAQQSVARHRAKGNQKVLDLVNENQRTIAEYGQRYQIVKKLDNLANGNNDSRLAFETYVLFSYFSDVLRQANQRLYKMTNGRYYFVHRKSLGDRRKRTGLEIDVMDNYTGKSRSVGSLSGGESFKASLALALGLSDVVQMNAGGIELNTIFIDEGFGTLDSESLDVTIDCLLELQSNGRLVGVISHVEELKDRLNAWLIVESTDKGSHAYFKLK